MADDTRKITFSGRVTERFNLKQAREVLTAFGVDDLVVTEGDPVQTDVVERLRAEDGLLPVYDAEGRQRAFVHPTAVDKLVPPFTTDAPDAAPADDTTAEGEPVQTEGDPLAELREEVGA